jgi:hypothetical protein
MTDRSPQRVAHSGGLRLPGGVVHKLPGDLRKALIANASALDAWKDITPLARNEFICWVEDAKQEKTRERRIGGGSASTLLLAGVRTPRAHRQIATGWAVFGSYPSNRRGEMQRTSAGQ